MDRAIEEAWDSYEGEFPSEQLELRYELRSLFFDVG